MKAKVKRRTPAPASAPPRGIQHQDELQRNLDILTKDHDWSLTTMTGFPGQPALLERLSPLELRRLAFAAGEYSRAIQLERMRRNAKDQKLARVEAATRDGALHHAVEAVSGRLDSKMKWK